MFIILVIQSNCCSNCSSYTMAVSWFRKESLLSFEISNNSHVSMTIHVKSTWKYIRHFNLVCLDKFLSIVVMFNDLIVNCVWHKVFTDLHFFGFENKFYWQTNLQKMTRFCQVMRQRVLVSCHGCHVHHHYLRQSEQWAKTSNLVKIFYIHLCYNKDMVPNLQICTSNCGILVKSGIFLFKCWSAIFVLIYIVQSIKKH